MAYWKIHRFWLVFTRKAGFAIENLIEGYLFVQYVTPRQGFLPCPTYQFAAKTLARLCKWKKHEAQMSSYCKHPKKHHSWPESRLLAPDHPTMKKNGSEQIHGSWTSYLVKAVGLGFFHTMINESTAGFCQSSNLQTEMLMVHLESDSGYLKV